MVPFLSLNYGMGAVARIQYFCGGIKPKVARLYELRFAHIDRHHWLIALALWGRGVAVGGAPLGFGGRAAWGDGRRHEKPPTLPQEVVTWQLQMNRTQRKLRGGKMSEEDNFDKISMARFVQTDSRATPRGPR